MIEDIIQILVLIGMMITAYLSVKSRDLMECAILLGVFSFLLSLEFFILQAPDVAIAEAGIGAGLTTAIFVMAVRKTTRWEVEE
ncbi:MAG: DUF4040 domain-containing protein [Euryarchaeota archaeon]|nr:DUF4040 domain-containing protein [Euryarchaeota archaeon]